MVRVENGQVNEVSARELDVVRWGFKRVDCSEVSSEEKLMEVVNDAFGQEVEQAEGRPLMLRLELHGPCPFHGELLRDSRYWQSGLEGLALDIGDIWLEKILFHTRSSQSIEPIALQGSPMEGFLKAFGDSGAELFEASELQTLCSRLPVELFKDEPLIPEDAEEQQILLEEIRDTVLARILQQVSR